MGCLWVAPLALEEHFSGGDVESGEQGCGAVADVVVGHPFDVAEPHGQRRPGALERLDLSLLVDAQHRGVIGRVSDMSDRYSDLLSWPEFVALNLKACDALRARIHSKGE